MLRRQPDGQYQIKLYDRNRVIELGKMNAPFVDFIAKVNDYDLISVGARFAISEENFGRLADNLLVNSIAALPRRGSVDADLRQEPAGLVLRITDTGPGIDDAFLPHAFERFSRPDDSRTASTGGSGLGLALVQAIAIAAHGTVDLRNTGTGLAVTVSIPKM